MQIGKFEDINKIELDWAKDFIEQVRNEFEWLEHIEFKEYGFVEGKDRGIHIFRLEYEMGTTADIKKELNRMKDLLPSLEDEGNPAPVMQYYFGDVWLIFTGYM